MGAVGSEGRGKALNGYDMKGKGNRDLGREWRIRCGDRERRFYVYTPNDPGDPERPRPAIFVLHGTYGNAQAMCRETGFSEVVDRGGAITVYPDGVKRSWADGRGFTPADLEGVDDVAFLDRVFHICSAEYPLDPDRMFVVGFSSGGFLAQRLVVEFPGRFAAMAVVSAVLASWLSGRLQPGFGTPALFVLGASDPVIPYNGEGRERGAICSAEESARLWAECNGLDGDPRADRLPEDPDGFGISIQRFGPLDAAKPVLLYTIHSGGHVWPGTRTPPSSPRLGPVCHSLNATALIWDFFSQFPRSVR